MAKTAKKIPDGYTAVTPYLTVKGAAQAIDFYKKAFGAEEVLRLPMPDGKIAHAEISIGGAIVMLHDEAPDWKAFSPQTVGDTSVSIMLYVNDVDAVFKRAVAAGATSTMEVADQFYGDRTGQIEDPFGHVWSIQTRVERVSPKEMQKRLNALLRAEASALLAKRKGTAGPAGASAASKKASAAKTRRTTAKIAVEKAPRRQATAGKGESARRIKATATTTARKVPNKAGRRAR